MARFINPETFEEWKWKAERWGYTVEHVEGEGYYAMKNGGVYGAWTEAGEEYLSVGRSAKGRK